MSCNRLVELIFKAVNQSQESKQFEVPNVANAMRLCSNDLSSLGWSPTLDANRRQISDAAASDETGSRSGRTSGQETARIDEGQENPENERQNWPVRR
jgi:hypothetical protein